MRDLVLISYTPLSAGGGVPRWNRDFIAGFPGTKHYSWQDVLADVGYPHVAMHEWDHAKILNRWLIFNKKITKDDIIIADGFWGLGLEGYNVISVAHGIWSHLTFEDVGLGKEPEFATHHAVQVDYRRSHLKRGGKIVAVSDFINRQMKLQWGFDSDVINNAIDLEKFRPATAQEWGSWHWSDKPVIIHGVTTANKGFEHIEALKRALPDVDIMLLDDAEKEWELPKYTCLRLAHLVVQPSAYEGNSYFVLETLASGVPIVAYDVGLLNSLSEICKRNNMTCVVGGIMDRSRRSPEETVRVSKWILSSVTRDRSVYNPRQVAELFSLDRFHQEWRTYLERYERDLESR